MSREEFRLSWHWRTAFSIGCGLVSYSTQISLEEEGHSEELPWTRGWNPLGSQDKRGHFPKQQLLDFGWGLAKERPNC